MATQPVSGQSVNHAKPLTASFKRLGFVARQTASATILPPGPDRPLCEVRALPLLSDEERQQRDQDRRRSWLDLVTARNYQQALQSYQHGYASGVDHCSENEQLLGLLEYFLVHQSYCEARGLIKALGQQRGIQTDPAASARLKLLAFLETSLTGSDPEPATPGSPTALWNEAQRCSRPVRSLLLTAFVITAQREMAMGRRKAAARILDSLAAKEQHQDPLHDNAIDVLRQVCDYGTLKTVQGQIVKTTRKSANVTYGKKHACAIDSISIYNNGELIIVSGWYIGDSHTSLSISLAKNRCLLTSQPTLVRRHERGDLDAIVTRYGLDASQPSGFNCTLVPDPNLHAALDWSDGETCDVILSTETSFSVLTGKSLYKELTLADVRKVIGQVISDDLRLNDYLCAQRLKAIWSEQIKNRSNEEAEHYIFGARSKQPDVSILIPLYGRLDFMEFQLHWFFSQQKSGVGFRFCYQIIYCLDDPGQKDSLLRLANKCAMLYGVPFEIVINSTNLGYAASNNIAARYALSDTLLLLNSDVIPRDHDAIDTLIHSHRRLPAHKGALGAKLLYPSNDIQHVGMTFYKDHSLPGMLSNCWLNEHPHKHIKHTSNPDLQAGIVETEAATAACLLIDKEVFEELGGFQLDYICGDFEDSDLCLRLRQSGRSVMVCLDAVFFHLERQSMVLQAEHGHDALKLVAFNAFTHHERHSATIEDIKSALKTES